MGLVLALLVCALKNCPAGLCAFGCALNLLLLIFTLLPLVYTVAIIALRDGCANVELLVPQALAAFGPGGGGSSDDAGGSSSGDVVTLVLDYYLGDPATQGGRGVTDVVRGVFDVDALKLQINATVTDALGDIRSEYSFKPAVRRRRCFAVGVWLMCLRQG